MEKKQTAVEFYRTEFGALISMKESKFQNENEIFEQAKQMEKEQIMDAWDVGLCTRSTHDICSEYYYNDTFKGGRG
jgi:hypothetical protein